MPQAAPLCKMTWLQEKAVKRSDTIYTIKVAEFKTSSLVILCGQWHSVMWNCLQSRQSALEAAPLKAQRAWEGPRGLWRPPGGCTGACCLVFCAAHMQSRPCCEEVRSLDSLHSNIVCVASKIMDTAATIVPALWGLQTRLSPQLVSEIEVILGEHEADLEGSQQRSPRPGQQGPCFPAQSLLDLINRGIQVPCQPYHVYPC